MNRFVQVFNSCKSRIAIIGMVHVRSLPMTPLSQLSVQQLIDISCEETLIYKKYGIDAICVENMFDIPYVTRRDVGPEVTAIMTRVCSEVKKLVPTIPCGVQVLAGLSHESIAVALSADLQFVRVESFVFGHIADEGYMDACAGSLLRYRKQLNANNILIFTDIKKKHCSHSITSDLDIVQTAKAAQFFLSDGLIVTGLSTGHSPDLKEVSAVRNSLKDMPVLIGSGVNDTNLEEFVKLNANAAIIGSHFKVNGVWNNQLSEERIAKFMEKLNLIYLNKSR